MIKYCGIDAGKGGSITFLTYENDELINSSSYNMPETIHELFSIVREERPNMALLEEVHAMPQQGVVSMFTFGRNFGICESVLAGNMIPYILKSPQYWQKLLSIKNQKGSSYPERKALLLAKAMALFPTSNVTKQNADSYLIALSCRKLNLAGEI